MDWFIWAAIKAILAGVVCTVIVCGAYGSQITSGATEKQAWRFAALMLSVATFVLQLLLHAAQR